MRVRFQQDLIEQSNALTDALTSQDSAISVQASLIQMDQLKLGLKKGQGDRCQASVPQPISNNVLESSKSVNILCWNLQGYSYRKYELLRTSHIILAQEANLIEGKQDYNVYGYQSYIKERIGYSRMTLIRKKIPSRRVNDLETQNTLVVAVFFPRFSLLVVNIHLTGGSKKEWKATLEKFQYAPSIIGGDINYQMKKNPNPYYDLITKDVTRKNVDGTKGRQIDYLMIRKNLDWQYGMTEQLSHFINFSDHKPLTTSIFIPKEELFQIPVINTKLLNQHLFLLKEKPKNIFEYMQICNNPSFYGVKYIDYQIIINKKFSESIEATKALLFSKKSKEFYNLIQHSRNLKPYKKEGSIMNCVQLFNGKLIFDQKMIISSCIQDLLLIQQGQIFKQCDRLPQLTFLQLNSDLVKKLRGNRKAVSYDLVELKHLVNFVDTYYQLEIDLKK